MFKSFELVPMLGEHPVAVKLWSADKVMPISNELKLHVESENPLDKVMSLPMTV